VLKSCENIWHFLVSVILFYVINTHTSVINSASAKSRLVLPFWYWLTQVVPEKGPLNGCLCVCVRACVRACVCVCNKVVENNIYCRFFLKDISDESFLKHKQSMLRKMENYLRTTGCRRRFEHAAL